MVPLSSSFVHFILPPAPLFRASWSVPPSALLLSRIHRRPPPSSPPTSTSLFHSKSDGYGYGGGLTDDGDFAILGINASSDEDEDGNENEDVGVGRKEFDRGTSIGSLGVGNMLFDESLLRSGRVDMGTGSNKKYGDFRGNVILNKTGDTRVKKWLLDVLPSLDAYDLESYAEGLTNIGYNPSCPSQCELTYDDLEFMKLLHRRYLYREITGEGHPFIP
jgi:hypothetical protein